MKRGTTQTVYWPLSSAIDAAVKVKIIAAAVVAVAAGVERSKSLAASLLFALNVSMNGVTYNTRNH